MSDYISKVVSKVYAVVDDKQEVVAEVIENPGCGFDYLIRIDGRFKKALDIWLKCLQLCNISVVGLDNSIIEKSINDGYYYTHEEIAVIVDEVIQKEGE